MELMDPMPALVAVVAVVGATLWWLRRKGGLRLRAGTRARGSRRLQKLERLVLGPHHALHLVRLDDRMILVAQSPAGLALLEDAPSNDRIAAASAARAGGDSRG